MQADHLRGAFALAGADGFLKDELGVGSAGWQQQTNQQDKGEWEAHSR